MATKFSGGTYVNTTFTGGTIAQIITAMETQLVNAGWTVVSGSGTTNVLMQTAQDPTTLNQGRVRIKTNGGSCATFTIENVSGSKVQTSGTSNGCYLLPAAAKTFRILASKYRFEVFTPGASLAREFVCAGILWIPTPYQTVITEAIYMQGNACSDTDGTTRGSFRNTLGGGVTNCAGIVNGSLMEHANDAANAEGDVQLRVPSNSSLSGYSRSDGLSGYNNLYRWHDGALDMADAIMGWATSSYSNEALIRGQVYDWTIISDSFAADLTDSWNDGGVSHNWYSLTNSNLGTTSSAKGTIWVATS